MSARSAPYTAVTGTPPESGSASSETRTSLIPVPSVELRSAAQPVTVSSPMGSVAPSVGFSTTPRTSHASPDSWSAGTALRRHVWPNTREAAGAFRRPAVVSRPYPLSWDTLAIASPRPAIPLASTTTKSSRPAIRAVGARPVTVCPPRYLAIPPPRFLERERAVILRQRLRWLPDLFRRAARPRHCTGREEAKGRYAQRGLYAPSARGLGSSSRQLAVHGSSRGPSGR